MRLAGDRQLVHRGRRDAHHRFAVVAERRHRTPWHAFANDAQPALIARERSDPIRDHGAPQRKVDRFGVEQLGQRPIALPRFAVADRAEGLEGLARHRPQLLGQATLPILLRAHSSGRHAAEPAARRIQRPRLLLTDRAGRESGHNGEERTGDQEPTFRHHAPRSRDLRAKFMLQLLAESTRSGHGEA
jgi:hypothetical protein